jgi:uridine kinase
MNKTLFIGIAGGTGSGKTTIVKKLKEYFKHQIVCLPHDCYYRDQSSLTLADRKKTNYDHPRSLETNLLIEHIKKLQKGKSVLIPTYDFVVHNRTKKTELIKPKPIVIVEGILIFENEELRNMFDIKVFVDTDADIRFGRKIKRDLVERGRTLEFVMNQYLTMARPMHLQFVEPSKRWADIIIPEGGHNQVALKLLINTIINTLG